jgi:hypothetical protein
MTQTFSVRNFERFQHYKDRSPPWIKLYNELLDDYSFGLLPDASKLHLVAIWLLASRSNNRIPHDPGWIAKRISATEQVDLGLLQSAGFIELHEARGAKARRKQTACPESEAETEPEGEKEDSSGTPDPGPPVSKPGKKTYPALFEEFWHAYPTDALMSKSKAFEKWGRLTIADRAAALASVPAFRAHCAKDVTYRPVHAERFLSQRRFDGFAEIAAEAAADADGGAAQRTQWDGKAAALVDAIGPAKFAAWFSGSAFEPGPPQTLRVSKLFVAEWIRGHYAGELERLYGDVKVEVRG